MPPKGVWNRHDGTLMSTARNYYSFTEIRTTLRTTTERPAKPLEKTEIQTGGSRESAGPASLTVCSHHFPHVLGELDAHVLFQSVVHLVDGNKPEKKGKKTSYDSIFAFLSRFSITTPCLIKNQQKMACVDVCFIACLSRRLCSHRRKGARSHSDRAHRREQEGCLTFTVNYADPIAQHTGITPR